jgi:anti-sigma-K factor RskA
MELQQDNLIRKDGKFADIVARLKTAIQEFKTIAAHQTPPGNKKDSQVGEDNGGW